MTFLKTLLAPPVFDDEVKTREANLLNRIIWGLVIAPLPYVLYILIKEPELISRTIIQFLFSEAVNIFLLWFMRRGNVRAASTLQVFLLGALFTIAAFTGNGVNAAAYTLGYPLTIFIAGSLLGQRSALATTGIVLTSGGLMVLAENQGWINSTSTASPTGTWLITLGVFPMFALFQYLTGNELRKALSRAHASEERYRLISEISSDYTFSTELAPDGKMNLVWVAGAFEKITGFTYEEYVASGGWLAHIHPDDRESDIASTERIKANQPVVTEVRTIKKNGEICWVQVYAHPVWDKNKNQVTGIVGAVQDITERKQSENTLTWERDLLQIFMDNIPDNVYFKDTESRFIRINKTQANFLGLNDPQDAIGKTDLDFQHPDLARQFLEEEKQIIATGQPVIERVEYNPTEDGKPRWLTATKTPVKDSSGNLLGTIGISRDITEQKQTEAMLAYERDILQIFMDNIPDQVYFKDSESRFVRINQGQAYFLGIDDPQDAIGKTDLDFQRPELAQEFLAEEKRIMETGQPVLSRIEFNPTKDGKPRWLSTSKVPAKNELGQIIGIIGISIDVTEQKLAGEVEEARRRMLEKVLGLGKQVAAVSDLPTTLKRIWHAVHDELNFDRLGIFLYNAELNSVDGTFGTSKQGEMSEEWDLHIYLNNETAETLSFRKVIHEENGVYTTHNFSVERNIPDGHIMYGVKDYAAVAMWAGDKPMGVICVDNLITGHVISEEQLEALRLYAGYAGLAIETSRLKDAIQNELEEKKLAEEVEQRRRQMLEKVVRLGKRVAEVANLETTLERIWHAIHDEIGIDRVGIFFHNEDRNSMDMALGTHMDGSKDRTHGISIPTKEWKSFKVIMEEQSGFHFTPKYSHDNNLPEDHEMYGVKDHITVAAWIENKPVAVIVADNNITKRPITEQQLEALRLFAGYAGLAIENSRLNEAILSELNEKKRAEEIEQRRRQLLEKVLHLGKHIAEVSDLQVTLERIWHVIHGDLGFDRIGIFFINTEKNTMDRVLGTDLEGNMDKTSGVSVQLSEWTIFSAVLERPDGFYQTHNFDGENNIPKHNEMYGVKDYAAVAVWTENKRVAVICVDNLLSGRPFEEEALEILRLFAGYAGFAIENSRLKEAILEELAEQKHLEENEQRRRQTLEKVMQLGKEVTEVSDIRTTLQKIWNGVRYDLDFDRVSLFTYDSQENTMIGAYGTDQDGNIWDTWHIKLELDENSLFYKVLIRPDGFYLTKDYEKEFNLPPDHEMAGVKYAALVAVWAGNKPIALISVDQATTGRPILNEELEALRLFAGYAGLAISNATLNDALEDELSQKKNFIDELEAKNAELERFTYTASHDLKSPLVTITGFLGYLEKDALEGNQERMKSSIVRINSAAEKMQALLNDLLELSRIGRLMNPPESVPFGEIVHEAIDRVRGRLDEVNAIVEIQTGFPTVHCDRIRLIEVIQNLIENAVKYAKPDSHPHIEIGSNSIDEKGYPVFHVRDDGIGIDPQYHERIFGLFNKLDARSEGTGIGLSLVKRIIEVHNGRVWVESEKGQGATFYFSLPTS